MSKEVKKPYRVLLGNRIYLKLEMPTYTLEVAEEVKKRMVVEAAQKLNKGVVYDVGTTVVVSPDSPKVGDKVMVSMQGVTRGEILNISPDLTVVMISPLDIIHIW